MSGKKSKKKKGYKCSLQEFLADSVNVGSSSVVIVPKVDELEDYDDDKSRHERFILPTCPRASRGLDVDPEKIPTKPPYTAYIANLPFDIDRPEIEKFFCGLSIISIRLPTESGDGSKYKGFGYVEFDTRQDLLEALEKNDELMRNRKIRVDIAEGDGGNMRRGFSRNGDWSDRSGSGGFRDDDDGGKGYRSFRRDEDLVFKRSSEEPVFKRGGGGDDDRDHRNGSRDDRGYSRDNRGFDDRNQDYRGGYQGYRRDRGYRDDRDRGYSDRYDDRYGGNRYDDRRGGSGYRRDDDRKYRSGGREDDREPPKERVKLNLKPRSLPADGEKEATGTGSSAIFGSAKPVDTAAREAEIEKKMLLKDAPAPPAKKEVSSANIFGSAKPVDTASKELQIEEKLKKIRDETAARSERRSDPPPPLYRDYKKDVYSKDYDLGHRNPSDRHSNPERSYSDKVGPTPTDHDQKETQGGWARDHLKSKKEEVEVLDTTNRFATLGLYEEEEEENDDERD